MKLVRNLLVWIPYQIIEQAHIEYKKRNGEYAREGGFTNKGPLKAVNEKLWNEILLELYPKAFHKTD